ncbi:MAG: ubiquinone/menaquinone biosynthesis methyltransferase [Limnochordia bacterium]|jgi:demethylmenaquinone methyltransferase/2-methoxy-6-polyprenyl-1,4-benzoquinol methylase
MDAREIRDMFSLIAPRYDLLNNLLSLGCHQRWRRWALRLLAPQPGDRAVDLATGTGDMALLLAKAVAPGGQVLGVDFCPEMLARAQLKAEGHPWGHLCTFTEGDILNLDLPPESADLATIAFGLRNVTDLVRGLGQIIEILKPEGKLLIIDLAQPNWPGLDLYLDYVVPWFGRLFSPYPAAYEYLPRSLSTYPAPEELKELGLSLGLRKMSYHKLWGGLVSIHLGVR